MLALSRCPVSLISLCHREQVLCAERRGEKALYCKPLAVRCSGLQSRAKQLLRSGQRSQRSAGLVRSVALDSRVSTAPSVELQGFQEGEYRVEGSLECPALPPHLLYDVLTDYERLTDIFDSVERTEVLHCDGQLQIRQDCRWEFLIFSGSFSLLLNVQEDPQQLQLTFDLVQSSFMRSFVGTWAVRPLPGAGGRGCLVHHQQRVKPSLVPPNLIGEYTGKIFVRQVTKILENLRDEAERRQAVAGMVPTEALDIAP